MNIGQLTAQGILSWLGKKLKSNPDVAKIGLPKIDVPYFLKGLSSLEGFESKKFSLALVGFGLSETDLSDLARRSGLSDLRAISDDLHVAGDWRNKRKQFGHVIALAYGRHAGVHTLQHFSCPTSRELASGLLLWASDGDEFAKNPAQKQLLVELANNETLTPVCSLEGVTKFLSEWRRQSESDELDAPRLALTQLGLFYDPQLFSGGHIAHRLGRNIEVSEATREMPGSKLREKRKRINKYPNPEQKTTLLLALDKLESFKRGEAQNGDDHIALDEVLTLIALPEPTPEDTSGEPLEQSPEENEDPSTESHSTLRDRSIGALLDGDDDALTSISAAIEAAWEGLKTDQDQVLAGEYAIRGERHTFDFKLDTSFHTWLEIFCSESAWGGLVESEAPSIALALATYEDAHSIVLSPDAIVTKEGQDLSVEQLCADWDRGLQEEGLKSPGIANTWSQFRNARNRLAPHIQMLVVNPLEWLPGRAEVLKNIEEYLALSASLYEKVQTHYRIMAGVSEGWAKALLESLLSLDILQVRIRLTATQIANKAVMLPLHPLHLWRYQRLAQVLRGLGTSITDEDRKAIFADVKRPEHFLSVILLGTIPAGKGANQILPVSNELNGLATFENLINAYTGIDGAETLIYAIGRYATLARHHARPLRIALINPPEPDRLMAAVVAFLNSPSFRQPASLPSLRIELYATPQHSGRLEAAMRLEDSIRDLVQEKLSSGRLQLQVREQPIELPDIMKLLERRPCHIAAIFDEASIRIRRRTAGQMLPMSPFCVRRQIRVERFEDLIRLEPTTDEPPFSEFMQLVNEADNSQRDSTPHAWADAESLRDTIDSFVQPDNPPAQWIFVADRALPTEGGLRSVRLLQRRNGQRHVLLVAKNYKRISELLRPAFDKCNLVLSSREMEALLDEGVNLIGAGLLELIQTRDGRADARKVLGLTGTLLAARHYRKMHPSAIIVSVDQELARLWLRIGGAADLERSDLIALRLEDGQFHLEALEIKTTADFEIANTVVAHAANQIAATVAALSEAIPSSMLGTTLSAPRNEMLKEVLVRGCQGRSVSASVRRTWGGWLKTMFRQDELSSYPQIKLGGRIVKVLMSGNVAVPSQQYDLNLPFPIFVDTLTEGDIQELMQLNALVPDVGDVNTSAEKPSPESNLGKSLNEEGAGTESSTRHARSVLAADAKKDVGDIRDLTVNERTRVRSVAAGVLDTASLPSGVNNEEAPWPPMENAFGMIGQEEAVRVLVDQAHFSKTFNEKFTDKLLVGPAGVGKSSIARGIARLLLSEPEIFFSGSDLREPTAIIDRLREEHKVPAGRSNQPIVIQKCLIFIDEVHGMGRNVETALLSALDDARVTSIGQRLYDFKNVIFVLATTDPGTLSEAFNSRPDKTWLSAYTLEELAGIVWLHGKEYLDSYELSKEACLEVAARMRCNPRRAVRSVKEALRPYFLRKVQEQLGEAPSLREIGTAMTLAAVSAYYDEQGVDQNGLDNISINVLRYLLQNGATSEQRLRKALGISNDGDFDELDEYLVRLQLIDVGPSGRVLTRAGRKYVTSGSTPLRHLISRQRSI